MTTTTHRRPKAFTVPEHTPVPPLPLWPSLLPPSRQGDDDLCVVSAHGVRVRVLSGRELLCGTSGLWNVPLGYGDEVIADAVAEATRRSSFAGVFRFENVDARAAAVDLIEVSAHRYERVMFTTSGGSANDAAIKLVRQYWALEGEPARKIVVSLRDSFHGLTFGAFALTGEDLGQAVYGVDQRLIRHVDVGDVDALSRLVRGSRGQLAAIILEPVMGTGTVPLDPVFLDAVSETCRQSGALLIADEVATGFGRTGPMFATTAWEHRPDLLITSKGLTNGTVAAAAILVGDRVAAAFERTGAVLAHAETQAGTAASTAAIVATIARFRELDVLRRGVRTAEELTEELDALVRDETDVEGRRGAGCFQSVTVRGAHGAPIDARGVVQLVDAARAAGVIVHPGPHGIQFIPALVSTQDDIRELVGGVRVALAALRSA